MKIITLYLIDSKFLVKVPFNGLEVMIQIITGAGNFLSVKN